jgi:glycerol-3-phosphate acyltransferase PlsY
MTSRPETRIYRLAGVCVLLVVASIVVPRFMSFGGGGIAAAANAIMLFLAVLVLAAGVSVYLLLLTLPQYRSLPVAARIAGVGPSVLIVGGLAWLVLFLRY